MLELRRETFFQRLDKAEKVSLYGQTIEKGSLELPGGLGWLEYGEASLRALREGLDPLDPLFSRIEAKTSSEWKGRLARVSVEVELARMLSSAKPTDALLSAVSKGVEAEVAGLRSGQGRGENLVLALRSLEELRRRNAVGVIGELRSSVDAYDPVWKDRGKSSIVMIDGPASRSGPPGVLARHLIELIGDLGDAAYERRELGGRSLREDVRNAESALLRLKLINEAQVVVR